MTMRDDEKRVLGASQAAGTFVRLPNIADDRLESIRRCWLRLRWLDDQDRLTAKCMAKPRGISAGVPATTTSASVVSAKEPVAMPTVVNEPVSEVPSPPEDAEPVSEQPAEQPAEQSAEEEAKAEESEAKAGDEEADSTEATDGERSLRSTSKRSKKKRSRKSTSDDGKEPEAVESNS